MSVGVCVCRQAGLGHVGPPTDPSLCEGPETTEGLGEVEGPDWVAVGPSVAESLAVANLVGT